MPSASIHNTIEEVLGAVGDCFDAPSAEALLRLRAPAQSQARIEELAGRCTEGQLSEAEREEYETLVRVGNFIAILQCRARRQLAGRAA
jgi:hypothetical protein